MESKIIQISLEARTIKGLNRRSKMG
jgi:hypothetical protein